MGRKFTICGAIILVYLGFFITTGVVAAQEPETEGAAIAATEQWLGLVDEGKNEESWTEAAGFFKKAVTQDQWVQTMKALRNPLGKVISREVKNKMYATSLPGAPDGEYVVIQFETSFENKKSAVETVTPVLEQDGKWRVSGYFIR